MNREDDQQLWDILGRGGQPRLSPLFARNVVREVRQQSTPLARAQALNLRILLPLAGAAVMLIGAAILWQDTAPLSEVATATARPVSAVDAAPDVNPKQTAESIPEPEQALVAVDTEALASIDTQDYDVVANLDDLLVLYESSLWDENSTL